MNPLAAFALGLVFLPHVALAAEAMAPGGSLGVYAAAGAFAAQLLSSAFVRRAVREGVEAHELACAGRSCADCRRRGPVAPVEAA